MAAILCGPQCVKSDISFYNICIFNQQTLCEIGPLYTFVAPLIHGKCNSRAQRGIPIQYSAVSDAIL